LPAIDGSIYMRRGVIQLVTVMRMFGGNLLRS